ncbi:hypothetical protein VaNZ11_001460 [Volvox africanus]|uniref:RAP domain-containing protein n=1 Tax=Volvox africanus TaxID=51714 RepID=A0ABQ5RRB8_9CHLO|nr:hypothetical protein VaNZ11_001460 [Volvox africanus]
MSRRITAVTASLAAGLPLIWRTGASSDGSNIAPGSKYFIPPAASTKTLSSSVVSTACNEGSWGCNTSLFWELPWGVARYLPGAPVHAEAEAPLPVPSLEAAYQLSLLHPMLSYMIETAVPGGSRLTPRMLHALEAAAVAGFENGADLTQVVTLAWALAWAGHEPGHRYIQLLQAASSGSPPGLPMQRLGAAHRAVLLWCTAMHGALPPTVWESGLCAVAASGVKAMDECTLLYLLHAALLYGADVAPSGRRTAVAAGPGSTVSPTSPAAASAASPACQPRATREEVLAAAAPLGRKALEKLAAAYGEYVPLHPAIEGPYMALLYILEQLATSSAGLGGRGKGSSGPLAAAAEWAPPGAAEQAAAILSTPKELARIKRDLLYHWRGDQLVDEVQRVRNELVHLLTRRMGLTVAQPDDVDVAVPSRWLAIYVRSSGSGGRGGDAVGDWAENVLGKGGRDLSAMQELEAASREALDVLLRDRFAPQIRMPSAAVTGSNFISRKSQPTHQQHWHQNQHQQDGVGLATSGAGPRGMWIARVRQLRRLGWRVVVVDVETWRAISNDAEREAYLQRLLRGRE